MAKEEDKQWFERGDEPSRGSGKKGQPASNRKPGNNNRGKKRSKVTPDQIKDKNKHKTPGPVGGKKIPSAEERIKPANPSQQHAKIVAQRVLDEKNHKGSPDKKGNPKSSAKPHEVKNTAKADLDKKAKGKTKPKKRFKLALKKKGTAKKEVAPAVAAAAAIEKEIAEDPYTVRRQRRAKKAGLRNGIVSIALVLMAATILLFVIHHLYNYIAAKPELQFISEGSIEHTIGARAMIVRNEVVIPAGTVGDLVTQAAEGSRDAKDQEIAMVVPDEMQGVVDNLRNTQSQISDVQQELIQDGAAEGANAIYSEINGSLDPIMDMVRSDAMNGNLSDMSSYASSITVLISQRESELSELNFDDERLSVLRDSEQSYENQLERNSTRINASTPGIVSFKLDGLENELSFDLMLNADAALIRDYINSSTGIITSDLYIESGENVARIAKNEKQYIVAFLDSDAATADSFEVGSKHTINVGSEGISIGKCVVERVEPTKYGLLVVFSTTRYVENLLDLRTVDIEVVITETEGLRVPIGALVNPDFDRNIATIYVNNKGFADEVSVIIEDSDREFAVIAPIGDATVPNLQTVIITNPSSIKPGEKVEN